MPVAQRRQPADYTDHSDTYVTPDPLLLTLDFGQWPGVCLCNTCLHKRSHDDGLCMPAIS